VMNNQHRGDTWIAAIIVAIPSMFGSYYAGQRDVAVMGETIRHMQVKIDDQDAARAELKQDLVSRLDRIETLISERGAKK
jgi:hypothetical protein